MKKSHKLISWIAALVSAIIMLQTLYFKFSAAPESVYIFSTLGLEPYGRIGIGIAELIASILILIPVTRFFGALFGLGIMIGAIFAHLTELGIEVENDGGYLFILSLIVSIGCGICLYLYKEKLKTILKLIGIKKQANQD
ncbi:DoxX family protein [Aurantibacillus circumpalustris]|uniref:DoxX family protein n=1 Tax=Aurantibacillus circumpalustris TaxID=3036359 RepID=UPI00295B95AC|nr:DoxX family protein [Aurantibacillus circumpalustris]